LDGFIIQHSNLPVFQHSNHPIFQELFRHPLNNYNKNNTHQVFQHIISSTRNQQFDQKANTKGKRIKKRDKQTNGENIHTPIASKKQWL
jgi:hypothetical protein